MWRYWFEWQGRVNSGTIVIVADSQAAAEDEACARLFQEGNVTLKWVMQERAS